MIKKKKKNDNIILKILTKTSTILKMAERSSTEYNSPNIYPNSNDQQFRSNKISEVRDYFIGEIKERELMSKRVSK